MGKQKRSSKDEDYDLSKDDPVAWVACIVALGLGIAMLAIEIKKGQDCKMRDIDSFAWNDTEKKGQIPVVSYFYLNHISLDLNSGQTTSRMITMTFYSFDNSATNNFQVLQAQAIFFLISSLFYIFGRTMRSTWHPLGNVLTGFCGQVLLFVLWIFSFLLSLLGFFWMYVANWYRNNENSSRAGDPNYCTPEVWYTSYVSIYLFWIFTGFMGIATVSRIYYLLLGAQYTRQKRVELRNDYL